MILAWWVGLLMGMGFAAVVYWLTQDASKTDIQEERLAALQMYQAVKREVLNLRTTIEFESREDIESATNALVKYVETVEVHWGNRMYEGDSDGTDSGSRQ